MSYIIHKKNKVAKCYLPFISFSTLQEAVNFARLEDNVEMSFLNLTSNEAKQWLKDNGCLIEESLTGQFAIQF